ncbi:OmpW family outer membrane protein [Shigella flexneri]
MATDNIGVKYWQRRRSAIKWHPGDRRCCNRSVILPPTLMAQWYFGDASSKFRAYVGRYFLHHLL